MNIRPSNYQRWLRHCTSVALIVNSRDVLTWILFRITTQVIIYVFVLVYEEIRSIINTIHRKVSRPQFEKLDNSRIAIGGFGKNTMHM